MSGQRILENVRMIYDCFLFFNELEMLDIRLHELASVVDKFVIVESMKTFSRKDKPLYFNENKELFKDYLDKIIHVALKDFPEGDSWVAENFQRNAIILGLKSCKDDDVIMVSDVDEIPRSAIFKENRFDNIGCEIYRMVLRLFYYYLNTYFEDTTTSGSFIVNYKTFKYLGPDNIRNTVCRGTVIENGGWHFSYMGGIENIQLKISSFAHTELDNDIFNNAEYLKSRVDELISYHGYFPKGKPMIVVDPYTEGFLPQYVTDNLDKFKEFVR
jgi:beta-1,4-mannosyl-glycoprotein beta-1,4-N-acetylglucosaminyltransferase